VDDLRLNNADILFVDVAKTTNRLIVSKLCFLHAFQEIIRALPEPVLKNNKEVQVIWAFKQNGFNLALLQSHSVYFFETFGSSARQVLDALELYRLSLNLIDDDFFETCYEEVACYLEELEATYHRITDYKAHFDSTLLHLCN